MTVATEQLVCEIGSHDWEREIVRGGKPRFCPQHRAEGIHRNKLQAQRASRAAARTSTPETARRPPASASRAAQTGPMRRTRSPLGPDVALEAAREQHELAARQAGAPAPVDRGPGAEARTRPFRPLYGHLADAVLAVQSKDRDGCRLALQRLSATAELLSLDPALHR